MKRWLGAMAFLGATAMASVASGQEIQIRGPLANAPSCRRCVQYRVGRLELSPSFGISLNDDFSRHLTPGLSAQYHPIDILGLGAYFGYGINVPTPLTSAIADVPNDMRTRSANVPVGGDAFRQQVGTLNWILAVPQITLIPLRGKMSLFQSLFVDTDFYIFAAPAIIGVTERANFDDPTVTTARGDEPSIIANQTARASRIAFTGTFGVGLNFYVSRFFSLGVEYRAYPFSWNTMGTDENTVATTCGASGMQSCAGNPDYLVDQSVVPGSEPVRTAGGRFIIDENDRSFRWNQMVNITLNFFLPTQPRIGD